MFTSNSISSFFPSIIQSPACASCMHMAVGMSTEAWATRSQTPEGNWPSLSSHQLPIAWWGWGLASSCPETAGIWQLGLASNYSHCVFISEMTSPCLEDSVFQESPDLWLLILCPPVCDIPRVLWAYVCVCDIDVPFRAEHSPVIYVLDVAELWASVSTIVWPQ